MERNQELAGGSLGLLKTQEIESLAGRELDVAIAERVMGLVPCQSEQHELGAKFYAERPCHAQPDSPTKGGETSLYSTDIGAAMQVVERLRASNWYVTLSNGDERAGKEWFVEFLRSDGKYLYNGEADCDSLPEAICRAALKAVKSKE